MTNRTPIEGQGRPEDVPAADQIRAFVERIERIEGEVKDLNRDKSEIFAEAKGNGFDVKALKIVIGKRRQDMSERMELEALVELYEAALGMRATYRDDGEEVGTVDATRAPAPDTSLRNPQTSPEHHAADPAPTVAENAMVGAVDPADTESTAALKEVPGKSKARNVPPQTDYSVEGAAYDTGAVIAGVESRPSIPIPNAIQVRAHGVSIPHHGDVA